MGVLVSSYSANSSWTEGPATIPAPWLWRWSVGVRSRIVILWFWRARTNAVERPARDPPTMAILRGSGVAILVKLLRLCGELMGDSIACKIRRQEDGNLHLLMVESMEEEDGWFIHVISLYLCWGYLGDEFNASSDYDDIRGLSPGTWTADDIFFNCVL